MATAETTTSLPIDDAGEDPVGTVASCPPKLVTPTGDGDGTVAGGGGTVAGGGGTVLGAGDVTAAGDGDVTAAGDGGDIVAMITQIIIQIITTNTTPITATGGPPEFIYNLNSEINSSKFL